MRIKKMRDMIASAALLLALTVPSAATGQSTDSFFYIDESDYRGGGDASGMSSWLNFGDNTGGTGSWLNFGEDTGGEATWVGFDEGNPLPTGGGLLVMALSGFCYGAARARRGKKRD